LPPFVEQSFALADGAEGFSPRGLIEAMGPAFERACPDSAHALQRMAHAPIEDRGRVLFEGCRFERYGVATLEEVAWSPVPPRMPWAFHQWLLDETVPAAVARP